MVLLLLSAGAAAETVTVDAGNDFIPLTRDKPYLHVIHEGKSVRIQRVQDTAYELKGYFARTARKCPPFCIQPMQTEPGVRTIGEVELFEFMETQLRDGTGVLIDARAPAWHKKGTIPGSVNYSYKLLSRDKDDPAMIELLKTLGAEQRGEVDFVTGLMEDWELVDARHLTPEWDFSKARDLVFWCNGPACGQSPRAIRGLRAAGYPADKLFYYRGGMQMWQLWGLTTVVPAGD